MILFLLATSALAQPGLDGSSALLTVPITETVTPGDVNAAMGLSLEREPGFTDFAALPVGISAGITDRIEVGFRLERDGWSSTPDPTLPASGAGFHARYRFVSATLGRPGLGAHVAVDNLQRQPSFEALGLFEVAGRDMDLHVAAGPRGGAFRGTEVFLGLGVDHRWNRIAHIVWEGTFSAGTHGLGETSARVGARFHLRENVTLMPWLGAGSYSTTAWQGLGLALALHTADPTTIDRDADLVVDWIDPCPYDPEDFDGFEDDDGCIDPDNDGDGIPDIIDPTPDGVFIIEKQPFTTPTPTMRSRIIPSKLPGASEPGKRNHAGDNDGT